MRFASAKPIGKATKNEVSTAVDTCQLELPIAA